LKKKLGLKGIIYKKDRGKAAVRLGRHIGKNESRHWVGAGKGDEMKNKIKKCRLTVGNLIKRAKGIYKKVSNV
jgi:hypothetical protein